MRQPARPDLWEARVWQPPGPTRQEVLNALVDLLWLTGDANRQAVRDQFAGTYVIRLDAAPAGTGSIRIRPYMFWGMTFFFREVSALTGS
jgi:hypothetical protein